MFQDREQAFHTRNRNTAEREDKSRCESEKQFQREPTLKKCVGTATIRIGLPRMSCLRTHFVSVPGLRGDDRTSMTPSPSASTVLSEAAECETRKHSNEDHRRSNAREGAMDVQGPFPDNGGSPPMQPSV